MYLIYFFFPPEREKTFWFCLDKMQGLILTTAFHLLRVTAEKEADTLPEPTCSEVLIRRTHRWSCESVSGKFRL